MIQGTRSARDNPVDRYISEQAEIILGALDLSNDEINDIIEEWCSYDFEYGHTTRMLAKLQRVAFEYILKRDGLYSGYRDQKGLRELPEDWVAVRKTNRE